MGMHWCTQVLEMAAIFSSPASVCKTGRPPGQTSGRKCKQKGAHPAREALLLLIRSNNRRRKSVIFPLPQSLSWRCFFQLQAALPEPVSLICGPQPFGEEEKRSGRDEASAFSFSRRPSSCCHTSRHLMARRPRLSHSPTV